MHLGMLEAMDGRFEQARELVTRGREIVRDLSPIWFAATATRLHHAAMLAGEPAAAEEALRESFDMLDRLGERGLLAVQAALLAQAIYAQSQFDEAERLSEISEQAASREDFESQILWRTVRAKVLAQRGEHDRAQRLAREAVSRAGETVYVAYKADALMDLAEVLRLGKRRAEMVPVLEEALRIHEQKSNVVSASRARAMLQKLTVRTKA
jgi:ATP/maltotriose-dependent transcriptional regulator MalT